MNRSQLEHLIRAAASIADDSDIVVVGSQAILGQHPNAPASLLRSMEADVYPLNAPERADLIDGSIGEGSPFHETFGYYARGVGPRSAVLAKLVAGRPTDLEFALEARRAALIELDELHRRCAQLDVDERVRHAVDVRIERVARDV